MTAPLFRFRSAPDSAMPVLVDGYNVLFKLGLVPKATAPGELQAARLKLLDWLAAAMGPEAREAIVVFDAAGAPPGAPGDYVRHGIEVRFAKKKQEADDLIEALIRQAAAPRQLAVVSSDHRLRQAAERRGARAVKAEEFLDWLERERRRRLGQPEAPPPADQRDAAGTPDEWLKAFGHLDHDPTLGRPNWLPEDFGG